jgi:hypothetical protein
VVASPLLDAPLVPDEPLDATPLDVDPAPPSPPVPVDESSVSADSNDDPPQWYVATDRMASTPPRRTDRTRTR